MTTSAKVLLDSISPNGDRLTTLEVTYPRIIHSEVLVHRTFSRNSASSRAIPIRKMLNSVLENAFIPTYWGANQQGMVAERAIEENQQAVARAVWITARDFAVRQAEILASLGVHKQTVNRLLEPFMYHTVIITATDFSNFFALRIHDDAQPEIREAATAMHDAMAASTPTLLQPGEWHLPITPDIEELKTTYSAEEIKLISAGRCARVSYLTHFGMRDPQADIDLAKRLIRGRHLSPFEHVATPTHVSKHYGNLKGWIQMRKSIPNESDFGKALESKDER